METTDEFLNLRRRWDDLFAVARPLSPFLTWEWMYAWWLCYGRSDPNTHLAMVTVSDGPDLVALLPTCVRPSRFVGTGLRTLTFLGTRPESSDYLDLIHRDPRDTDVWGVILETVRSHLRLDRIRLDAVLDTSMTATRVPALAAAAGLSCRTSHQQTCPYLPIDGEWNDYLLGRGARFRQNLRRRTRRLFERNATFDWVTEPTDLAGTVRTLFDLHHRRFARKGTSTRFLFQTRGAFHTRVSRWLLDRDALRLFRLRVEGKTVAALYCVTHSGRLFFYQSGLDPAWEPYSAGTVLMGQVLRHAHDHGLSEFDFLRGGEAYKFQWTTHARDLVQLDVGLTRKGDAAAAVAHTVSAARRRWESRMRAGRGWRS